MRAFVISALNLSLRVDTMCFRGRQPGSRYIPCLLGVYREELQYRWQSCNWGGIGTVTLLDTAFCYCR